MKSDTPETDAEITRILIERGVVDDANAPKNLVGKSRLLERQRNIAIAEIERILADCGHSSDVDCECDDCNYIRPIENALRAVKSLGNVQERAPALAPPLAETGGIAGKYCQPA